MKEYLMSKIEELEKGIKFAKETDARETLRSLERELEAAKLALLGLDASRLRK